MCENELRMLCADALAMFRDLEKDLDNRDIPASARALRGARLAQRSAEHIERSLARLEAKDEPR